MFFQSLSCWDSKQHIPVHGGWRAGCPPHLVGKFFRLGSLFFCFCCDFGSRFWGRDWDQFLGPPYCGLKQGVQFQVPKTGPKKGPRNKKKTNQVKPCDVENGDRDGRLWALGAVLWMSNLLVAPCNVARVWVLLLLVAASTTQQALKRKDP